MTDAADEEHFDGPAGGWGSLKGIMKIVGAESPHAGVIETLMRQNKPKGHMCTSCAWTKPAHPHAFEFCENGAKATVWDLASIQCTPTFFAAHTVTELLQWSDHQLETTGRLTQPLRYDAQTDHYVEASWEEAYTAIGAALRALEPASVIFYTSGRASLETAYLYALFARAYGHNNLPDSSNMCHETTSVTLLKVIGSSVGTCVTEDFESCDMMLFFGQNTGSNSPRFLHLLEDAAERGCTIVTFNPVRETGLVKFTNPQDPLAMLTGATTQISDLYLQIKPGGDIAALIGLCKLVLEAEAAHGNVIDHDFISNHTSGFETFAEAMRKAEWDVIESASGLSRTALEEVATLYISAKRTVGIYGMGLTQHVHGSQNIALLVNFLMLKGNIGRVGTGISPIRGHSNVQGQRTVGITEKPELVPMDKLVELFGFDPPRTKGRTTVDVIEGLIDGSVKGFIGLGGNFARAIPDQGYTDALWSNLDLNVQIATKLNRSHLLVGKSTWLLPCLVRAEEDRQKSGPQTVTIEDSLSHIHGSIGNQRPASEHLRSEIAIVAGLARASLSPNPRLLWEAWSDDYNLVRDLIEKTYPEQFKDFNDRLFTPGGFYKGNSARKRQWHTESGKAQFMAPTVNCALGQAPGRGEFTLITLRSNDQFNTTIYGFSDRLRGLEGSRNILLMCPSDIDAHALTIGQQVRLECVSAPSSKRVVKDLRIVAYDLPPACVAAYYPETNALIPYDYHDLESKTPAYKGVPVRVVA